MPVKKIRTSFFLQIFCDETKKVKVYSDFLHLPGCLLHGENQLEIELEGLAEFLKVYFLANQFVFRAVQIFN